MFFVNSAVWLVPGKNSRTSHQFGGNRRLRGLKPRGREKNVHLIYDFDLADELLPMRSYYDHLTRLPCLNALQYNCQDIVYRVLSDTSVKILHLDESNSKWDAHFPFEDYPAALPESPIVTKSLTRDDMYFCNAFPEQVRKERLEDARQWYPKHVYTPRVGGSFEMIQGVPEWDCQGKNCIDRGQVTSNNKAVFLVLWEQPIPTFNIWEREVSKDPKRFQSVQIIFSLCRDCGAIHSCNRCD